MTLSGPRRPGYAIFVDEAGDPGIRAVSPLSHGGASEWFTLGAVVIDQARDSETVEWVREIKHAVRQVQRPYFHYKDVPPGPRRELVCSMLAEKPCRLFAVVSHKPNMEGHENSRAQARGGQHVFYNWVLRVLLERVTQWIRAKSLADHGQVLPARLVLSATGGLNYNQLRAYHEVLRLQGKNAYLNKRTIAWDVLNWHLYEPVPARQNAGVQLADIVASAFYQASNAGGKAWSISPAMRLEPRLARHHGAIEDCGLTLLPLKLSQRKLDQDRRRIFEAYGFHFG